MSPRKKLFGAEWAKSQFGGVVQGIRNLTTYGTKGPVKAPGNLPLDVNGGTDHGHEGGNTVGMEGPGSGKDGGEERLILGPDKKQELFGVLNEGLV